MKNNFYSMALVAAAITCTTAPAFAADGTITINGTVTNATCKVTGAAGNNLVVTLDTISASTLSADKGVTGIKPFTIELSECGSSSGNVRAGFELGSTIDIATGRLKNTAADATAAKNVSLQLLTTDLKVIKVGDSTSDPRFTISDKGAATLNYSVGYFSTGIVTAGTVTGSVTYNLVYN